MDSSRQQTDSYERTTNKCVLVMFVPQVKTSPGVLHGSLITEWTALGQVKVTTTQELHVIWKKKNFEHYATFQNLSAGDGIRIFLIKYM